MSAANEKALSRMHAYVNHIDGDPKMLSGQVDRVLGRVKRANIFVAEKKKGKRRK